MADTTLKGYPTHQSSKQSFTVDHAGPASYAGTAGEVIGAANLQTGISTLGLAAIDQIIASPFSVSGNYYVIPKPVGKGTQKTFNLQWFAVTYSTGVLVLTQVAAAVDLSGETVRLTYIG